MRNNKSNHKDNRKIYGFIYLLTYLKGRSCSITQAGITGASHCTRLLFLYEFRRCQIDRSHLIRTQKTNPQMSGHSQRRKSVLVFQKHLSKKLVKDTHISQYARLHPARLYLLEWPRQQAPGCSTLLISGTQCHEVSKAQKPYKEEAHPHLNRMNSGVGASYAFYCGDGSTIQRTDGNQTGIGWVMPSECKRKAQITNYVTSSGKGARHSLSFSTVAGFCIMSPGFTHTFPPQLRPILQKWNLRIRVIYSGSQPECQRQD